jgi:hypothetical protein
MADQSKQAALQRPETVGKYAAFSSEQRLQQFAHL